MCGHAWAPRHHISRLLRLVWWCSDGKRSAHDLNAIKLPVQRMRLRRCAWAGGESRVLLPTALAVQFVAFLEFGFPSSNPAQLHRDVPLNAAEAVPQHNTLAGYSPLWDSHAYTASHSRAKNLSQAMLLTLGWTNPGSWWCAAQQGGAPEKKQRQGQR